MSDRDYPLPPATLEFLVLSLRTQTEMQMGLIYAGEEEDQPEPDFRIARHSIDLLAMLQEKTRGNTTIEEQRLIENSLTELRFRYVQALEHHQKTVSAATSGTAPAPDPNKAAEPKSGRTSDHMEPEGQAGA
ncbi:MAG TPA: DUF1844 domain-containing protein [Bryobacteraceae bacterium]|nr:DUF1844 domain-containing protein [Bryobacteraceae bacterium]